MVQYDLGMVADVLHGAVGPALAHVEPAHRLQPAACQALDTGVAERRFPPPSPRPLFPVRPLLRTVVDVGLLKVPAD